MANKFLVGTGAGIVGLLVGLAFGGPDDALIANTVNSKVEAGIESAASASSEQISAMSAEIAGLKAALATAAEAQGASETAINEKLDGAVAALTARMDAMSSEVGSAAAEASSAQTADIAKLIGEASAAQTSQIESAISSGLDGLKGALSQMAAIAPAAPSTSETAEAAATASAPAEPEIEGVRVGQTENLLEGKVRVFVSAVDTDAGTVRVAINGLGLQTVGQYNALDFNIDEETPCSLTLDAIVEGHVQLSASCAE